MIGRNFFYWQDFANLHGGYSYVSFIVLYVTAAYLRKYPPKKRRWLLPVLLMIILVPVLSALIFSTRGLYAQRDAMVKMAERYDDYRIIYDRVSPKYDAFHAAQVESSLREHRFIRWKL